MFVEKANSVIQDIAGVSFYIFFILTSLVMCIIIGKQIKISKQLKTFMRSISNPYTESVIKNLRLTAKINYFLLAILFLECFQSLSALIFDASYSHYNSTSLKHYQLTNTCVLTYPAVTSLKSVSGWWIHLPMRVSKTIHLILFALINLLLEVLYVSYLSCRCKKYVLKGLAWIIFRFILLLILSSILETTIICFWFLSKLFLIYDMYNYIIFSIRFYKVLKGRRDEEKYHGEKIKYNDKDVMLKQFLISSIILLILLISKTLSVLLTDWGLSLDILITKSCYFSYITANILQLNIPNSIIKNYTIISPYIELTAGVFFMIYQGMSILLYSLLIIDTSLGLCSVNCMHILTVAVKRKRDINVSDDIRPLMQNYHKKLGLA